MSRWDNWSNSNEVVEHGLGEVDQNSFSPSLFQQDDNQTFIDPNNDFLRSRSFEDPFREQEFRAQEPINEPIFAEQKFADERELKESQSHEPQERPIRQHGPRRRIIRGKVDDLHHGVDDPTLRNRVEHALQYLSKYGLRNDLKTPEGKEQKLDPDENLSRIIRPFRVKLGDHTRKFAKKNYLNRHIIFPNEVDNDNYYYRVDDNAKNQEHKGLLIEVIGSKWIGSSEKIAWLCKTVGSGQEFYTLYIDATSRIRKNDPNVQESLRAKKQESKICFREDTVASLVEKLETAALQMRQQSF
jgi:hypothetical protein